MADHTGMAVGQQFGDYRLIRFLGQGSFGDVYLGEQISDKSLAAVKVLQARLTSSEDLKEFINEARTFRLKHPHIVQLLDFGLEGSTPFLIMDYAPNGTLRQRYPRGTRLAPLTIVSYVEQIAAALQYAHDRKLIHRDVKPENILLAQNNEVLLSDFGIAVVAHSTRSLNTQEGGGTVPYMAPEQIQGKPRPASDQYALGIMVYEWICGTRPFTGTGIEIAMQHALAPPPPLREHDPAISPDVEQVVMTALAKDPQQRFMSIQAFATALQQAYQLQPEVQSAPTIVAQPPAANVPPTIKALPYEENAYAAQKTKEQWLNEGNAHYRAKRYQEALAAYEQAIRLGPNYAIAFNGKGDALSSLKRYQEALEASEHALRLDPNSAKAYTGKGNALYDLKRYQKALTAFEQAIRLDPNFAIAYLGEGNALHELYRYQEALAAYEQAIRLAPNLALAYNGKGKALLYLKHYEQALATFEQAILRDPNYAKAYNGTGAALWYLKRYVEALAAYEQAIRLDPNNANYYYNMGDTLKKLGKSKEARQAYEKAKQLGYKR